LLTANAAVISVALLVVLLTALGAPLSTTVALVVVETALCIPAAKLVARVVEKKECTFTITSAFFVGVVTVPWAIFVVNWSVSLSSGMPVPLTAAFAAVAISYAFGEGLGRLACISFGCCYGKPVSQLPQALQRVFTRWHFVFFGQTKKIAYASGLEGERVLPIQAVTTVLYLCTRLAATLLFLRACYATALICSLTITQGWRVVSESLRADYRGHGTITAYQRMSLLTIPYMLAVVCVFPAPASVKPNIFAGLRALWDPAVVLFLQGLWATLFVFFGKSMVTGSAISFHVHHDRI
jgi:hypothetical protein